MSWLTDLFMLFFPSNCLVCGKRLQTPRAILCLVCELQMPRTGFVDNDTNPVCQVFWGRIDVRAGTSLFRFEKGSSYQNLLHDLKYRGNKRAGLYLGYLLGQEIKNSSFSECDLLVPVPLHKRRMNKRGYNQSELIARGISEITGIPVESGLIRRKGKMRSQTSKNRLERFENMAASFCLCTNDMDLHEKSILIIDDVITTGATLEACSQALLSHFRCVIYVATVSWA